MNILFFRHKKWGEIYEYDKKIFSEYPNFTYNRASLRLSEPGPQNTCSCEKNLESSLESDLQNGYLNYYKILKAELYAPSAEDADNPGSC